MLGPKHSGSKKNRLQKNLYPKKIWSKNFFGPIKIWVKKKSSSNKCLLKNLRVLKKFWFKNIWVHRNFGQNKEIGLKDEQIEVFGVTSIQYLAEWLVQVVRDLSLVLDVIVLDGNVVIGADLYWMVL